MKRALSTIALLVPLVASAGDIAISCIGPESDDCPVAVDVRLELEKLVATFWAAGKSQTLNWCSGSTFSAPHWSSMECNVWGDFRVINGELTKRQLAEGAVSFEIRRLHTFCTVDLSGKPVCEQPRRK